ncbi:MAG: HNH endonuclease [Thermomicrobiales bacterium]
MFFRRRKAVETAATVRPVHAARQSIGPKVRFEVLRRDNYTCRYCGAKGPEAGGSAILEVDHRIPVSQGGTNDMVNLWTACWDCNRGKGATKLDRADDSAKNARTYRWETCRVDVNMGGDHRRQSVVIQVNRYGAGKSYPVVKPKEFKFSVALPHDWRKRVSWDQYFSYLSEKEQRAIQKHLDEIDKRLEKGHWEQVAAQEYRRKVK